MRMNAYAFVVAGVLCALLSTTVWGDEVEAPAGELPDYRWVVEKQSIIVRPKDIGLHESVCIIDGGLTFAKNGDLLLAACCLEAGKTFIMRSSDRGETWTQQGVLEHRGEGEFKPLFQNRDAPKAGEGGAVQGMYMTKSGRLVAIYWMIGQDIAPTDPSSSYYIDGTDANFRFPRLDSKQWGAYSDDEGKTWQWAPMDIKPFGSMDLGACSQIFEDEDGTLVASFRGHLTQGELDSGITSNGIIRSHDGGLTWGDANPIVRAQPGSGLWFNENQVIPLPDGRWLCMMRVNDHNVMHSIAMMRRSYSEDKGRTWTYPVRTRFRGGEPGTAMLPDGAVISAQTGQGLIYEISYNGGLTWLYWGVLYELEGHSVEHFGSPIIRPLDKDTAIAVYHRGEASGREKYPVTLWGTYGPIFIGASWLHKVPANSPEAAALEYPEWLNMASALRAAIDLNKTPAGLIATLPVEWRFKFDEADQSLAEEWQKQTSFDDWAKMRIDEPWTKQGEERLGVGWYAMPFEMPENGATPLLIVFGAVDGVCEVFLDGQKIGEQTSPPEEMWNRPFAVSLEKGLPAGHHTLVVRVKKTSGQAGMHKYVRIMNQSAVILPLHMAAPSAGNVWK